MWLRLDKKPARSTVRPDVLREPGLELDFVGESAAEAGDANPLAQGKLHVKTRVELALYANAHGTSTLRCAADGP